MSTYNDIEKEYLRIIGGWAQQQPAQQTQPAQQAQPVQPTGQQQNANGAPSYYDIEQEYARIMSGANQPQQAQLPGAEVANTVRDVFQNTSGEDAARRIAADRYDLADRLADIAKGTFHRSAAGFENTARDMENAIGGGASAALGATDALLDYAFGNKDGNLLVNMLQGAGNAVNTWQNEIMPEEYAGADKAYQQMNEELGRAKEGLGFFGRLGVDIASGGLEMLADRSLGSASMVPMAVRAYGLGSLEARQQGADLGQSMLYGAKGAAIEYATEKISQVGGLRGGKGWIDGAMDNALNSFVAHGGNRIVGQMIAGFGSEAAEEMLSDVANFFADKLLREHSDGFDFTEGDFDWGGMWYDGLVGGLLGLGGGAVEGRKANNSDVQQSFRKAVEASSEYHMGEYLLNQFRSLGANEELDGSLAASIVKNETARSAFEKLSGLTLNGSAKQNLQAVKNFADQVKNGVANPDLSILAPVVPEQAQPAAEAKPAQPEQPAAPSAETAQTPMERVKELYEAMFPQTPQNGAGAQIESGEQMTQPQGQGNPAVPSPELNSQTKGQALAVPSQVNIDNAAEQGYNTSIRETEGISDDQGRSADEAGAGLAPGEGSLGTPAQSGQRSGESSGVHGIVRLSDSTEKAYEASGVVHQTMQDWSDDGAAYSSALDAARNADPVNGWAVTPQSAEDLQGKKLYMTPDQSAGVVVTSDGDIEGVFRNKQTGQRGALDTLLPLAVENGGTKLDCYGDLVHQYARYGFVPVARVAFNEEYANEGWDPSKGTPDVYIMVYDGETPAQMIENKKSGNYHKYTQEELDALPQFDKDGYDDAIAYRDNLLAERDNNRPVGGEGGALTAAQQTSPQTTEQTALAERGPQEMGEPQPAQKRSQTESNTLQHIADVTGGEQEKLYYTPKSERESLTAALNRVRSDMNGEMQSLLQKPMWNGEDIDTALTIQGLLQMDAVRTGDKTASIAWARAIQQRGTESGRALQAFNKWTRSGIAAATESMKALNDANGLTEQDKTRITNDVYDFAEKYDSIEDGDFASIRDLILRQNEYRKTGTFAKGRFEKILNQIKDFDWLKEYALRQMMNISSDYTEEADLGQKVKTWQVNAQLSRLGTFFRNIGGNGIFGVQDTLAQNSFGVALDALISKKTGKRTMKFDRSWTSSEARKGARDALLRSILEVAGDVDMSEGGSKYGQTANRTNKMSGKAGERFMSRWEQLLGYSLTSSDRFFRGAIEAEVMRQTEGLDLTDEQRQALAEQLADYRLFQNKGTAYGIAKGVHDLLNLAGFGGEVTPGKPQNGRKGGFGVGDMLLPYPGVPANLGVKALEYSPANIIKGGVEMFQLFRDLKYGKGWDAAKQQKAVMDMARGLSGAPLIALLAACFKAGIFKNADDEEDEDAKALAAAEGRSGIQINLDAGLRWLNGESNDWQKGDKLMSIGWLEPLNAFMAIASLIGNDQEDLTLASMGKNYAQGMIQGILEMPVMETLANISKTYEYSKADTAWGKVMDTGVSTAVDALTGMLPAPISQTARAMDPYYRDTAGDTVWETGLNRVMNAIPGLRQMLPEKLDNFGNPKENATSAYDRWMNSFVRPGAITDYKADDMYQALDELAQRTGDPDVYPNRKAPGSIGSGEDKIKLNADEKWAYQYIYGQTAEQYYNELLLNPEYQDMSDDDKIWMLGEIQDYASYKAQQFIYNYRETPKENKQMEKIDSVLQTGVDLVDYVMGKRDANEDGEGSLKGQEVYYWLTGSDYTDAQKSAIWDANKGSSNKTWNEYYGQNPVTLLANIGLNQNDAREFYEVVDADGKNGMSQEELFNYYKTHPWAEDLIRQYWEDQRGFSTSWERYKAKH